MDFMMQLYDLMFMVIRQNTLPLFSIIRNIIFSRIRNSVAFESLYFELIDVNTLLFLASNILVCEISSLK